MINYPLCNCINKALAWIEAKLIQIDWSMEEL